MQTTLTPAETLEIQLPLHSCRLTLSVVTAPGSEGLGSFQLKMMGFDETVQMGPTGAWDLTVPHMGLSHAFMTNTAQCDLVVTTPDLP